MSCPVVDHSVSPMDNFKLQL